MNPFRKRKNRRTRTLITGVLVGGASIYLVAYYLEVPGGQLVAFLLGSIGLVAGIILLAILTIVLVKGLGRLLGGRLAQRRDNDSSE